MADNKKLMLNLFGGLQEALFWGDPFPKGEFVSFMQPGQFVSTNLQQSANSDAMWIQSDMSNLIIDTSYVNKYKDVNYSTGVELLGSVNQVYEDVLLRAAVPYKELPAPILAERDELRRWLVDREPTYSLYKRRYDEADDALQTERNKQEPDAAKVRRLQKNVDDAWYNWELYAEKSLFDRKFGRLISLTREDPSTFWERLNRKLRDQKNSAPTLGDYYQTFLEPPISAWNAAGWATFERTISERDSYQYSKSTSWSGGFSVGWGLWSIGGGAGSSSSYHYSRATSETVSLKFDYLRVRILRPWLVPDVFGYRFWTWKKEFGCTSRISDGGNLAITPPVRPIGRMPVLPTYLILVRNVELSAAFSQSEQEEFHKVVTGGGSIGFGPFSIGGSYREETGWKHVRASFDGITFRIAQPQIIARVGIMLPMSPNPEPGLAWQDDACPLDQRLAFESEEQIRSADEQINEMELRLLEGRRAAQTVADEWFSGVERLVAASYSGRNMRESPSLLVHEDEDSGD